MGGKRDRFARHGKGVAWRHADLLAAFGPLKETGPLLGVAVTVVQVPSGTSSPAVTLPSEEGEALTVSL